MQGTWNMCWQCGNRRTVSPSWKSYIIQKTKILQNSIDPTDMWTMINRKNRKYLKAHRTRDFISSGINMTVSSNCELWDLFDCVCQQALWAACVKNVCDFLKCRINSTHLPTMEGTCYSSSIDVIMYWASFQCFAIRYLTLYCTKHSWTYTLTDKSTTQEACYNINLQNSMCYHLVRLHEVILEVLVEVLNFRESE